MTGEPSWKCDWCGKSPVRDCLDGDALCQQCCDKWAKAEGRFGSAQKDTDQ